MNQLTWANARARLQGISPSMFPEHLAKVLFDTAQSLPESANLLEIGAYKGYSTVALAAACVGTARHVWTIDTFTGWETDTDRQDGPSYYDEFCANLAARQLESYVTVLRGKSEAYYAGWQRALGLLFIDGNHLEAIMRADLETFFPFLVAEGWLAMHDVPHLETHPLWGLAAQLGERQTCDRLLWAQKRPNHE